MEGWETVDIPRGIISGPFNKVEQNSRLKILIETPICFDSDVFLENYECRGGRGLVTLKSLSILEKAYVTFNFR